MTGNEKFRLKVVDDLRKNRVIVESDEDYITILKKANSDLGDLVRLRDEQIAKLTAERDELLAATEAIAINSEECLDFDECTAMLVSIDDYHKLTEAVARAKGEQ